MTCLSCNSITPHSPQIMHSIAVLCLSLHFLGTATAQRCWHSELERSLALWQAAHLLAWAQGPGPRHGRDSMLPDPIAAVGLLHLCTTPT